MELLGCDCVTWERTATSLSEVCTVEPLYNGQIGDWPFVLCREVVRFSEVIVSQNKLLGAIEVYFCEGIPIIQIGILFGEIIMSWLSGKTNCKDQNVVASCLYRCSCTACACSFQLHDSNQ